MPSAPWPTKNWAPTNFRKIYMVALGFPFTSFFILGVKCLRRTLSPQGGIGMINKLAKYSFQTNSPEGQSQLIHGN